MPYTAEISRKLPTCFLFLIDRSGSMSDPIGGGNGMRKADVVADAINRLLNTITIRCSKGEGIRNYFLVGVIGYGAQVGPACGGALAGRLLIPVSEIADNPLRVERRTKKVSDGAGGLVDEETAFPIWFEPTADGMTPMCQAFNLAGQTISEFINQYPGCFPPLVVNVTDGESTDGDVEPIAANLRNLATSDGNVLLFNLHVSSVGGNPVQFPDAEQGLPDDFARLLFRMSSPLPPTALPTAREKGFKVTEASRGFVFNADLVSVVQFLDIGTRVDKNLR
jgi:hypothetical protein